MRDWVGAGLVGLVFAVAGIVLPEYWLPWFLALSGWIVFATGADYLADEWLSKPITGRYRILAIFVALLASLVVTRFLVFGTIALQTPASTTFQPGDDVKIPGKRLPEEHAKILTINLEPKDSTNEEREAANKGVSNRVLTVALPDNLKPGEYELIVHGPMWPLFNDDHIGLTVLGAPEIANVAPAAGFPQYGPHGTHVVIYGKNFDVRNNAEKTAVFFGNAKSGDVRLGTDTECGSPSPCLVAAVPGLAPEGQVVELTMQTGPNATKSKPVNFLVLGPPRIDQAALAAQEGFAAATTPAFAGSEIEIKGEGFPASDQPDIRDTLKVTIDRKPAEIVRSSVTSITVRIPFGAAEGSVEVWTAAHGGLTASGNITILGAPTITNWTPSEQEPGQKITIEGRNFDLAKLGNNKVMIGGVAATVTAASRIGDVEALTVVVPDLAASGEIVIQTPAETARADNFLVRPIISDIAPKSVYVGETLCIRGKGLFPNAAATVGGVTLTPGGKCLPRPGEQVLGFVIPQGVQTGHVTLSQKAATPAVSSDPLVIDKMTELTGRIPLVSRPVTLRAKDGATVELRVSCKSGVMITIDSEEQPKPISLGGCPVDIDVDYAAQRAYTANADAPPQEGITVLDVSDPRNPTRVGNIDSGGANPTRLRIVRGGQIVATTNDGIFTGKAGGSRLDKDAASEPPLRVFADEGSASEGRSFVAVVTRSGQVAVFTPNGNRVISLNGDAATSAVQSGRKLYVVNHGSDNVSVIDVMSSAPPKPIPVDPGAEPIDLAFRPGLPGGRGELFVTEPGRSRIAVIDTTADKFATSFDADIKAPTFVAFGPNRCVAVAFDAREGVFGRFDPDQREFFGQPQGLVGDDPALKHIVGVMVDQDWAYALFDDGTKSDPAFHALCRP
jgi:YVTN family beta-propeller protein